MKKLILVRHAETDLAGTFCGHSDPPVNAQGKQQIAALRESLAGQCIDAILSSDLLRAQQTASALQSSHNVPLIIEKDLREICFGEWEGLTWNEIETRLPEQSQRWLEQFPERAAQGGERYAEFYARTRTALDRALAGTGNTVAVVTHAGVLRVALEHLMNFSFDEAQERKIAYGSYFIHEAGSD